MLAAPGQSHGLSGEHPGSHCWFLGPALRRLGPGRQEDRWGLQQGPFSLLLLPQNTIPCARVRKELHAAFKMNTNKNNHNLVLPMKALWFSTFQTSIFFVSGHALRDTKILPHGRASKKSRAAHTRRRSGLPSVRRSVGPGITHRPTFRSTQGPAWTPGLDTMWGKWALPLHSSSSLPPENHQP